MHAQFTSQVFLKNNCFTLFIQKTKYVWKMGLTNNFPWEYYHVANIGARAKDEGGYLGQIITVVMQRQTCYCEHL